MDILQLLVKKNILKKEIASQIAQKAKETGEKPEELLLARELVDEGTLFAAKSEDLKIPLRIVESSEIPLKVLELIPEDSAKYYKMVPLSQAGDVLEIGMVHPDDTRVQEALKFLARRKKFSYRVSLITLSTFGELMKQYRRLKEEVKRALEELESEMGGEGEETKEGGKKQGRLVEEAPIAKMVAVILRNAVDGGASDIHIEPFQDSVRVRFRFLGELHPSLTLPSKVHHSIVARIKILSSMKIDETRIPQDGRFSANVEGKAIDFRVATFPTPLGEKVALRVLDPAAASKGYEQLGIEGLNLKRIKDAMKSPFGLILVTGPTGSGKSTTLYTILQDMNTVNVNIVSLEDPVEYYIDGVNQSQMRPDIGYDFAQGLRQVLRQDPDIIMVGEVRDKETAFLVIHAALTGHIVFSTLHTNNSVGVVPRLLDMGVDRFLIPATLRLAIAQRLVRRLCEDCKEKVEPEEAVKNLIIKEIGEFPSAAKKYLPSSVRASARNVSLFRAVGCKKCGSSGYAGRVAMMEVLTMTDELADIVLKEPSEAVITEEARRQGMITMRQDGILKVLDGVTTIEEVLRVTAE